MVRVQLHIKIILKEVFFVLFAAVQIIGNFPCSPVDRKDVPVRIRYFDVPTARFAGESALLSCHYELDGNETLYAVKWYKDYREFFRFVPGADPMYKTLTQPGVDVDSYRSNRMEVYLRNLGLESFGNYTCQVSTDGPYFWCVQNTKYLDVVVPPSNGPVLMMKPEKSEFELGDNVSIKCTSGRGKPAPDLTWYINDRRASDPKEREVVVYPDNLESSSLILRFHLIPDVFVEGKVVLKCVASVHQMQSSASKEIVASGRQVGPASLLFWMTPLTFFIQYMSSQMSPE